MKFYFAPLEGLTGYFSPFILADQGESFKSRELNDLLPENNRNITSSLFKERNQLFEPFR